MCVFCSRAAGMYSSADKSAGSIDYQAGIADYNSQPLKSSYQTARNHVY